MIMLANKSLLGAILIGTLFVLAQLLGCSSNKGVDAPATEALDHSGVNDDQNENVGEETAVIYTWDDSYGQEIINKVVKTQPVQTYMDTYKSQGYRFAPHLSFELEGYGTPEGESDSTLVRFVTIAMTYQPDTLRQAMYITHTECEVGFIVAPYMLSFVEPEPNQGFFVVADGIWRLNYPAQVYFNRGANSSTLTLLDDYLDCVAATTADVCLSSITLCPWMPMAYPQCVAFGCAGVR
jgi:hypothetical protein